jgi:outer membrane biosynthesis protein TonB
MFIQHFGGLFMADETPEQRPAEELKKDTVRINLPPGLTGRSATPSITPPNPSPSMRPPSGPSGSPEEEAKKETSVMGRPAEAPKPKKDTSRVQVTAAKPVAAESPRPTVKLQRDPAPAPAAAGIPAAAPAAARVTAGTSDGGGGALSLVAMVLSLAVAGYLAYLAFM